MKFITSSTEFFELHNNPKLIKLRESILAVPIDNWKYINTLKFNQLGKFLNKRPGP